MNYQKIYNNLMSKGNDRVKNDIEYYESHHVVPRCLGGSNDKSNLILLTPEEHYVAHQLLIKIYPSDHRMAYAANMMTTNRTNNKLYGWIRRRHSKAVSIRQSGNKNNQYGTRWIYSNVEEISKRISKNIPLPDGWVEGRKMSFDKTDQPFRKPYEPKLKLHTCKKCNIEFKHKARIKVYCSEECKPDIIRDNFDNLYVTYKKYGSIYQALKRNNFGYAKSVYKRFQLMVDEKENKIK